jgi:hypothetical protein
LKIRSSCRIAILAALALRPRFAQRGNICRSMVCLEHDSRGRRCLPA